MPCRRRKLILSLSAAEAGPAIKKMEARYLDNRGNEILVSPFVSRGTTKNVDPTRALSGLRWRPKNAVILELAHAHPRYEIEAMDPNHPESIEIVTAPLSGSDIKVAAWLSLRARGLFVRIKAVCPNGYFYWATFFNGIKIADPILGQ